MGDDGYINKWLPAGREFIGDVDIYRQNLAQSLQGFDAASIF